MKITDKMRLDWLMEHGDEFLSDTCGGGCCMRWCEPSRREIDAKIKADAAIRASKPRAGKKEGRTRP